MYIKKIEYDNVGIARGYIVSDSGNEYISCIDKTQSRFWCSCANYTFKKSLCKHIMFLMFNLDKSKMVSKKLDRVKTGSQIIDDLLGGGVPYGIVSGTYGKPMAGKSMFCYQVGLANLKESPKKTLYIDTEGIRSQDIKSLLYKFGNRFDLDNKTINDRFDIITTLGDIQLKSIQKLFKMFGQMLTLDQSKGGKYSAKFEFSTPLLNDKKLEEYSMIIIDSLSKPIKDTVGTNTANLPTRSAIQERIFGLLSHVAVQFNQAIIINHHVSSNPVMPFGTDFGHPIGGDSIMYNTKYVLEFWDATNKIKTDTGFGIEARRVRLYRHPTEQITGEWIPIRLQKDVGYVDK